jgi:cell division control protein 6
MRDMPDAGDQGGDPLFDAPVVEHRNEIFKNRDLVDTDHVPDADRIIGRDEQIEQVAHEIGALVVGEPASSVLIFGKTGTGKSLVAKHVMGRVEAEADRRGVSVGTAYINCSQTDGPARVPRNIGRRINPPESGVKFPSRGISTDEYYERLWSILNQHYDGVAITLDEVDRLRDDSPLMILSRARENGSIDIPISIVAISNKIDYRNQMNERTKSSFGHREYVFDPYDANQLREILRNRSDAFHEGVIEEGVIPRVAALAAKEHGDARKGIELLFSLGKYAIRNGYDTISEEDVPKVREMAEAERLRDLITGLPAHSQHVIGALAALTISNSDEGWFRTSQVLDAYKKLCNEHAVDPVTHERVRQLLEELSFLEITESRNQHQGSKGQFNEHTLNKPPEIIKQIYRETAP